MEPYYALTTILTPYIYIHSVVTISLSCHRFLSVIETVEVVCWETT